MAGRILKDDIEALRRQADIVAVVSDYTTLKRAGRSFKGLCPFHTEKTPSFNVTPEGNYFHCFGCGASGDIYDFLQRIEGLEFPEAVEQLARRTGFTLRYEELSARERRAVGERSRLVEVTAAARDHFRDVLLGPDGEVARTYLKERGFGREDADRFELGYAPNEWEATGRALTAAGFRAEDLIAVGLSVRSDRGGLRDRFRGRLVFPVHDPGGDVVGFGGRILPGLDYGPNDPPKYLNSPETALYKKARVLYGVPQARAEIVRAEQVLVCEGYTDVMALHRVGFANAVATCGTAVGVEHLRMVARYAPRVVLAFDGDEAGVKAAERAWEAARAVATEGDGVTIELRVLPLPDGRDPADLASEVGADGMRAAVDAAVPVVPFVLRHRLATADLATEPGRTAALKEALEVLAREPDPDLRREWARTEIAAAIGLSYDFVAVSAARHGVALDRHEGIATGPSAERRSDADAGVGSLDRARVRAERAVLRAALQAPELLPAEWSELGPDDFTHPKARAVHVAIVAAGGPGTDLAVVLAAAPDDDLRGVLRSLALEDDPDLADTEVAGAVVAGRIKTLVAARLRAEEDELKQRLTQLHHRQDHDEVLGVQRRLAELERRRRELTAVETGGG